MNASARTRGFTLIELMVTVAVLAILVGIAYPSYTGYVKRGNRGDAETQLTRMAQAEERWRTTTDVYTTSAASLVLYGASSVSPTSGTTVYRVTIDSSLMSAPSSNYFALKAVPQTKTLNATDGNLTLDSNGKKCWQKLSTTDCTSWSSN